MSDPGALPPDFRISLDSGVRRLDDAKVLVGGTPLRILRLAPAGVRAVDELAAGGPVGASSGRAALARRLLDAGMAHPRPGRARHSIDDVTIVVPVRDDQHGLDETLAAVGPASAVIVVDDGSTVPLDCRAVPPNSRVVPLHSRAVPLDSQEARVLRHDRSAGPAAARNTGWRAARTELVAFVDAGCQPDGGWLERLLPHFADAAVAAVAPRVLSPRDTGAPGVLAAYEALRSPLDQGPRESTVRPGTAVAYVPTATLIVRRAVLEGLSGFDESMRFGEDVDLVWRMTAAGWTVRYEPGVSVTHPARRTRRAWLRQRYEYGTSAAPLARRHDGAVAPLRVASWSAAVWALVALRKPAGGIALAALTTALLGRRLHELDHPWQEAGRLAGLGHLYAGRQVASAIRRAWWPIALLVAVVWPRTRIGFAAALTVPLLAEWIERRPDVSLSRWIGLRILDDAAYGAGLWAGCWRERSAAALTPDLTSWPGRSPASVSVPDP